MKFLSPTKRPKRSPAGGLAGGGQNKTCGGTTDSDAVAQSHERATQLLLILKWGGELTKLGQRQAIELGNSFRTIMYPDSGAGGLLRLHRCVLWGSRGTKGWNVSSP